MQGGEVSYVDIPTIGEDDVISDEKLDVAGDEMNIVGSEAQVTTTVSCLCINFKNIVLYFPHIVGQGLYDSHNNHTPSFCLPTLLIVLYSVVVRTTL